MKKRFIILIDFSAYSNNLLKYAYDWSKLADAELLLVHQTTPLTPVFTDTTSKAAIAQDINTEALDKLKDWAGKILPANAKIQYSVSDNHLSNTLSQLLSEPFEHLVFTGLKGTGRLKQLFIGSVALEVIENTDNTIVAMPKEISSFSPEKIYVAVSDKYQLNTTALKKVLHSIGKNIQQIVFFHVSKPGDISTHIKDQLQSLVESFANDFNTVFEIYEGDNAFINIKKVLSNKAQDLLIIQKGSHIFIDQFFRKFLINELVYEGQTPLIILPNT